MSILIMLSGVFGGALLASAATPGTRASTVTDARISGSPGATRVVFELSAPVEYRLFRLDKPDRVVLDLDHGAFGKGVGAAPGKGMVKDIRVGHYHGKARIVLDLKAPAHPRSFLLKPADGHGYRLVVDLAGSGGRAADEVHAIDAGLLKPRPVVIAIDAGHGGKDPGAHGKGGTLEKDVTLAIAKDLARRIDAQPGMHAVLTRNGDYYIPLVRRFEIARKDKADLFVSIHANSCPHYCDARGASVWVLSTHGKQSEAGRWLAKSENASDLIGGVSLDDKGDMLASVLLDLSQGASMHAAHEVGSDVLAALGKIGPLYRDTVQGANFVVLRSPDVPSILVETAFISNRVDERRLGSSKDRGHLAQAVLAGVKQYFETTPPPGTWFAAQRNQRLHLTASVVGAIASRGATGVGAGTRRASAASDDSAAPADVTFQDIHQVARGETLSGIAQHYGVTTGALRSANGSKIQTGGGIQAGQVLMIPNG